MSHLLQVELISLFRLMQPSVLYVLEEGSQTFVYFIEVYTLATSKPYASMHVSAESLQDEETLSQKP